jgi:hypothetical protein
VTSRGVARRGTFSITSSRAKLFFAILLSKFACQAPKPPNPLKQNQIELAF